MARDGVTPPKPPVIFGFLAVSRKITKEGAVLSRVDWVNPLLDWKGREELRMVNLSGSVEEIDWEGVLGTVCDYGWGSYWSFLIQEGEFTRDECEQYISDDDGLMAVYPVYLPAHLEEFCNKLADFNAILNDGHACDLAGYLAKLLLLFERPVPELSIVEILRMLVAEVLRVVPYIPQLIQFGESELPSIARSMASAPKPQ